jgi:long-chain acyl-CoA synthetase
VITIPDDKAEAIAQGMLVAWLASRAPDRPALYTAFGDRTYGVLNANINRVVRALRAHGLRSGDSVALMCTNRPEFLEVLYATQRCGMRLTPINWHLTGGEARYIVENCEAKAFIADAELGLRAVDAVGARNRNPVVRLAVGGELPDFAAYSDVLMEYDGADIEDPTLGSQMLYTSGTTGRPKGVHRTGRTATTAANIWGYDENFPDGCDVHLCTGPLYHAAPLAFSIASPMLHGVPIVVMDHWDPAETLHLIDQFHVTHTHMVPTMFHRMLALPDDVRTRYDLSSLRLVIHGAAPCPVTIKKQIIEWLGPIVVEYYAATEGLGTLIDSATWLDHPGSVGRPVVSGLVKVGDADGNQVSPGEIGLVWLKAIAKFDYYRDKDKTAESFRGEYFTLGDMGYLDEEEFLFLTDRTANLIISGGVNIYPAEVDAVLSQHPTVADVATIGVPNEEWGEEVKAVVQLVEGVAATEQLAKELIDFTRTHLAHFKCPRTIDFMDRLPREDTGKMFKRKLRELYRGVDRVSQSDTSDEGGGMWASATDVS